MRTLTGGRSQRARISTGLANHLRDGMKTFGRIVAKGGGRILKTNVKTLRAGQETLAAIVLPLAFRLVLETWRALRMEAARLDRQLNRRGAPERGLPVDDDRSRDRRPRRAVSSTSENPANFGHSRGAYAGLAARGCQSGEIEDDGHISKRGDRPIRSLLYEPAIVVLTSIGSESAWGLKLKERAGRRARRGWGQLGLGLPKFYTLFLQDAEKGRWTHLPPGVVALAILALPSSQTPQHGNDRENGRIERSAEKACLKPSCFETRFSRSALSMWGSRKSRKSVSAHGSDMDVHHELVPYKQDLLLNNALFQRQNHWPRHGIGDAEAAT